MKKALRIFTLAIMCLGLIQTAWAQGKKPDPTRIKASRYQGAACGFSSALKGIKPEKNGHKLTLRIVDSAGNDFEVWCWSGWASVYWLYRLSFPNGTKKYFAECELDHGMNDVIVRKTDKKKFKQGKLKNGGTKITVKGKLRGVYFHNFNSSKDFHAYYDWVLKKRIRINTTRKAKGKKAKEKVTGREETTIAMAPTEARPPGLTTAEAGREVAIVDESSGAAVRNAAIAEEQSYKSYRDDIVLIDEQPVFADDPPDDELPANYPSEDMIAGDNAFIARSDPEHAAGARKACPLWNAVDDEGGENHRIEVAQVRTGPGGEPKDFNVFYPENIGLRRIEMQGRCLNLTLRRKHPGYVSLGVPKALLGAETATQLLAKSGRDTAIATVNESATHWAVSFDVASGVRRAQLCASN